MLHNIQDLQLKHMIQFQKIFYVQQLANHLACYKVKMLKVNTEQRQIRDIFGFKNKYYKTNILHEDGCFTHRQQQPCIGQCLFNFSHPEWKRRGQPSLKQETDCLPGLGDRENIINKSKHLVTQNHGNCRQTGAQAAIKLQ